MDKNDRNKRLIVMIIPAILLFIIGYIFNEFFGPAIIIIIIWLLVSFFGYNIIFDLNCADRAKEQKVLEQEQKEIAIKLAQEKERIDIEKNKELQLHLLDLKDLAKNDYNKYEIPLANYFKLVGDDCFLVPFDRFRLFSSLETTFSCLKNIYTADPKNFMYGTCKYNKDTSLFFQMIREKKEMSDQDDGIYYAYYLLEEGIKKYYANIWIENFGEIKKSDTYLSYYFNQTILIYNEDLEKAKFTYYLMDKGVIEDNFDLEFPMVKREIDEEIVKRKKENFENRMFANNDVLAVEDKITIDDIDMMNGVEFENFIAKLFREWGYDAKVTKASGDQGIDVIADRIDKKIGIQAKCYSGVVGNKAIQEASAGKLYYKLDSVMVITNNYFTISAKNLAKANQVVLWDRYILEDKINKKTNLQSC